MKSIVGMTLIGACALVSSLAVAEATFTYSSTTGSSISFTEPACTGPFTISDGLLSCPTTGETPADPLPVGNCSVSGGATVTGGSSTAKTLTATCANATSWEWTYNGAAAPNATNSRTYTTPADLLDNSGEQQLHVFTVKATNAADTTGKTGSATITVNPVAPEDTGGSNCVATGSYSVDRAFDATAFDIKGVPYYPQVGVGKILALEFTPDQTDAGYIDIYSKSGAMNLAISTCPGSMDVVAGCKTGYYNRTGAKLWGYYETCNLGTSRTQKWYVNIQNKSSTNTLSIQMKNKN
ncbi:MAG: hypothetical protein IPG66_15915 [Hydrogenophilales bacterium]|nr:hypothetical protein [Hydrogenophilales bacterium]